MESMASASWIISKGLQDFHAPSARAQVHEAAIPQIGHLAAGWPTQQRPTVLEVHPTHPTQQFNMFILW